MLHISCNIGTHDLPDMYALSPRACGPWALGIHIRQITLPMLQLLHKFHSIHKLQFHKMSLPKIFFHVHSKLTWCNFFILNIRNIIESTL